MRRNKHIYELTEIHKSQDDREKNAEQSNCNIHDKKEYSPSEGGYKANETGYYFKYLFARNSMANMIRMT